MREIRIATAQFENRDNDKSFNLQRIDELAQQAAEGGAEIVYHETDSGGAVFSVGSISYPCSLPVDQNISRITRNVVDHFLL